MPNHFTLTFFLLPRCDVSCSHSNRDLFTCEDNMLFSHVKISCFRAKAHLVFHWYLYNKYYYYMYLGVTRHCKWHSVLHEMHSGLDCKSSGPGVRPRWGHYVFFSMMLYTYRGAWRFTVQY